MKINRKKFNILYIIVMVLLWTSILSMILSDCTSDKPPNIIITIVAMFFFGGHMSLKLVEDFMKED